MITAGNFGTSYCILDFTGNPLAGKGTWHLLPTTPAMLPKQNILTGLSSHECLVPIDDVTEHAKSRASGEYSELVTE